MEVKVFGKIFYFEAGGLLIFTDEEMSSVFKNDNAKKFIIKSTINDFINRQKKINESNTVLEICLKSSNRCNLRCSYCFRQEQNIRFNEGIIKSFIEKTIKQYKCEKIKIDLTGDSEPLLEIDNLKKIIVICNDLGQKYKIEFVYSLNSNGTIFNKEILDFLYNNSIIFGFTVEGFSLEKHRRVYANGNAANENVINNIKTYELNKNRLFGISMTLTSEHKDLVKEYTQLIKLCSAVSMRIVNTFDDLGVNEKNVKEWKRKYSELAFYLLGQLKKKKYENVIPILRSKDFFGVFIQTFLFKIRKNQSCLAGYRQMFLNYDGKIYLCPWGCHNDKYLIGNNTILNNEVVEYYKEYSVDCDDNCSKCGVRYICGGECHIIKDKDRCLKSWCDLKKHIIGLACYIVYWMKENDTIGLNILKESVMPNTYSDTIEPYLKVLLFIFQMKGIHKGYNQIKNEINCVDNGPSLSSFLEYLTYNRINARLLKEGEFIMQDKIYVLHKLSNSYNLYKTVSYEDATKSSGEEIVCIH